MSGQMIDFRGNGQTYQGYLSRPPSGKGPGIVVIQEWWGLVGHIKAVADRFAAAGFNALAPDLYQGEIAEEPDEAGKLMMALEIGTAEKIIDGAVERLLEDEATLGERVGIVGFCMGGQLSLYSASVNTMIGACVDFYGIHPNVHPRLDKLRAPVLGFFAEHDAYASPEAVHALSRQLAQHGKEHEFVTFPGTHHAFFNDDRPAVYDAAAAAEAWDKMVAFFRAKLGPA